MLLVEIPLFVENVDKKLQNEKSHFLLLKKYFPYVGIFGTFMVIISTIITKRSFVSSILFILYMWGLVGLFILTFFIVYREHDWQAKFYKDFVAFKNKPKNTKEYDSKWNYADIQEFQFFGNVDSWAVNIKVNAIMQTLTKSEYYDFPEEVLNFLKSNPNINFVEIKSQK